MSQDATKGPEVVEVFNQLVKVETLGGVGRELGRIYKMAEKGTLDVKVAWRLSQILSAIRQCFEAMAAADAIREASDEVLVAELQRRRMERQAANKEQ